MVKFEDDINVNIYNLYHKKMLNKRTQYVYVFYNNGYNELKINKILFEKIEIFENSSNIDVYTFDTSRERIKQKAEELIIKGLTNGYTFDTPKLTLAFENTYWDNKKDLESITYYYDDKINTIKKTYTYSEVIKLGAEA